MHVTGSLGRAGQPAPPRTNPMTAPGQSAGSRASSTGAGSKPRPLSSCMECPAERVPTQPAPVDDHGVRPRQHCCGPTGRPPRPGPASNSGRPEAELADLVGDLLAQRRQRPFDVCPMVPQHVHVVAVTGRQLGSTWRAAASSRPAHRSHNGASSRVTRTGRVAQALPSASPAVDGGHKRMPLPDTRTGGLGILGPRPGGLC